MELSTPGTATVTVEEECPPAAEPSDEYETQLHAILAPMELPEGTCFFAVYVSDLPAGPEKLSVMVSLAVPSSNGPDDLRSVATDIAHVLKETELGRRTADLSVTNWGFDEAKYDDYLIDENFASNPWDGSSSRQAELAIWSIGSKF
ncbi:hypothetical protein [Nocardia sp. NPDC051750]|uniref:hypothetical protein n=1 Tax=Nocardia sp. NPDC051750 TaxID=3364325 RepID=UPI0037A66C88